MSRKRKPLAQPKTAHFAQMFRSTMEAPAWSALSTTAQALYFWLKLEWRGPNNNNNGKIRLSVRQAAKGMGTGKDAAARAFIDLQAKGFLVITEFAQLGTCGTAKAPAFEITELAMPHSGRSEGRKLYLTWHPGSDFPVKGISSNNPAGKNGKSKTCPENADATVHKIGTIPTKLSR